MLRRVLATLLAVAVGMLYAPAGVGAAAPADGATWHTAQDRVLGAAATRSDARLGRRADGHARATASAPPPAALLTFAPAPAPLVATALVAWDTHRASVAQDRSTSRSSRGPPHLPPV